MKRLSILCQAIALVLLFQSSAYAHSTETINASLLSGLLHPLIGLDHLLAMIAIGLWSSQQKVFNKPATLAIIAGSLFVGFIISYLLPFYPLLEPTLAASILIISLFSLFAARLNARLSLYVIIFFVLHHGFAHGSEMQAGISVLYLIGFTVCSLLLQILGQLLPLTLKPYLVKIPSIMLALAGSVLTVFSLS
ncbi:HupE/UreJ family protein [Neptunomonas concharum]|uniref:HupE/UreJ family protein n=1 Tax=Neptunomonas concharum TaxID=1031538 RepID=A0A5P1R9U8_9GAMM|nr:HupE/UreJ family protein [Neptunomonas concharum]QEQ96373.1 HupE/UreJ family protein [Neptunomonas concharum]